MSVPHSDPMKQNRHVRVRSSSSTPSVPTPSVPTSSSRVSFVGVGVVAAPTARSSTRSRVDLDLDLDLDLDRSLATPSRVSLESLDLASFDERSRASSRVITSSFPSSSSASSSSESSSESDDDDDDESDDASCPPPSLRVPPPRLPSPFARRRRSKSASPLRITGELIPARFAVASPPRASPRRLVARNDLRRVGRRPREGTRRG